MKKTNKKTNIFTVCSVFFLTYTTNGIAQTVVSPKVPNNISTINPINLVKKSPSVSIDTPTLPVSNNTVENVIKSNHSLDGEWNWVFLDTNVSHKILITDVKHYPSHSTASGTIQSLSEQCPINLTVYNAVKTQLIASTGNVDINHDGHVFINIVCKNVSVLAIGYGLPTTKGSIVGRADVKLTGESNPIKQPFSISRIN